MLPLAVGRFMCQGSRVRDNFPARVFMSDRRAFSYRAGAIRKGFEVLLANQGGVQTLSVWRSWTGTFNHNLDDGLSRG
jgi:hypothetical protein